MKKALIIMSVVLAVNVILLGVFCAVLFLRDDTPTWQEQYDLGQRYLSDGDYEEAVVAFLAAVEIDPKRPEAYLGAAEAYIGLDDSQAARKILREGLRQTDDPALEEKLESIPREEETVPEPTEQTQETTQPAYAEVTVVDAFRDTIGSHTYCIPKIIMADGSEAPINDQIYDALYDRLEEEAYASNGTWLSEMSYTWGQNKGVVSLHIYTFLGEVYHDSYGYYNVSTSTGMEISQEEVLQAFDLTQEECHRLIREQINEFYDNMDRNSSEWANVDDLRQQSLAEENIRYSTVYVGEDGVLMAQIRTYTVAGSGTHTYSFALQAGATDGNEAYRSVIETVIAKYDEADGYGYGILYDVDGNGTDELIMTYDAMKETNGSTFPWTVYSVYTVENGVAVSLLDEEKMVTVAGGPSAQISVVEKDGKAYILAGWETGETADDIIDRYGEWTLYSVSGGEIITETFAEFDVAYGMNGIVYNQSSAIINGANKSYRDLENWLALFTEKSSIEHYAYGEAEPTTLEQLLEQLS